jgi:hypothetical protein
MDAENVSEIATEQREERLIKISYEKSRQCVLSEIEVDSYGERRVVNNS